MTRYAPALLAVLLSLAPLAMAAAQPFQKTTLQTQEFPGPVNHTVLVRTVVAKGASVAPHTHPGVEMAYIADGQAGVTIAGKAEQTLGPGDSFSVPETVVHSVRNVGPGPLTIVSTYVVDKTRPIATPAPAAR